MKNLNNISIFIITSLILISCGTSNVVSNSIVSNRKYTGGLFLNFKRNYTQTSSKNDSKENEIHSYKLQKDIAVSSISTTKQNDLISEDLQLIQLTSNGVIQTPSKQNINVKIKYGEKKRYEGDCDILVLKNGDEKEIKLIELGKTDSKYRKCNDPEGTIFTISNSQILMIKHSDGTKTVMSEQQNQQSSESPFDSSDGKNQLTAAILAFFAGALGIHRFYLGYTGLGVLYILTLGLCGIGALVDFILILTGNLKPKDGEYGKTL